MKNQPVVLFAFRGDPMCFVHVLLNALDLKEKGKKGLIILEGEAVTLVEEMRKPQAFLNGLYQNAKEKELFHGACKACAIRMESDAVIQEEGIPLIGDMSGHPAMADFIEQGYQIITF